MGSQGISRFKCLEPSSFDVFDTNIGRCTWGFEVGGILGSALGSFGARKHSLSRPA